MRGRVWRDHRGATTVEFAVIGSCLCLVTFAVLETGLLLWTKTCLQVVASDSARCGAVGLTNPSSICGNTAATQNFAVQAATTGNSVSNIFGWGLPVAISSANVVVASSAIGCNGAAAPGNYYQVSVTASLSMALPPPFQNFGNLTAVGCYPVP